MRDRLSKRKKKIQKDGKVRTINNNVEVLNISETKIQSGKNLRENVPESNLGKNHIINAKIIGKKKINTEKDDVTKKSEKRSFEGKGMTSEQARSIKGISNLGMKKPAWQ